MKSWQSHFPFFPKLSAIKVGRVGKKDPSKSFYVSQMMVFTSCPLEGQQGGAGGRCGPGAGFGLEASWLPLPVSSFAWHSADLCLQIVVLIVGFQLFSIESFQQTKCLGYHIQRSSVGASLCPCLPLLQPSGEQVPRTPCMSCSGAVVSHLGSGRLSSSSICRHLCWLGSHRRGREMSAI